MPKPPRKGNCRAVDPALSRGKLGRPGGGWRSLRALVIGGSPGTGRRGSGAPSPDHSTPILPDPPTSAVIPDTRPRAGAGQGRVLNRGDRDAGRASPS